MDLRIMRLMLVLCLLPFHSIPGGEGHRSSDISVTRITAMDPAHPWYGYFWRGPGELIYVTRKSVIEYQPVRLEVGSGRRSDLCLIACTTGVGRFSLSPDGEWLLYHDIVGRSIVWVVSSVSTFHRMVWPYLEHAVSNGPTATWLPDSHHWAEMTMYRDHTRVTLHSIDSPLRDQAIKVPGLTFSGNTFGITKEKELWIFVNQQDDLHSNPCILLPLRKARPSY